MTFDELISLAGTVAVLVVAAAVVVTLVRSRRPRADVRQQRAGRVAQAGLVVVLVLIAAVVLVFGVLASTDSRFRY